MLDKKTPKKTKKKPQKNSTMDGLYVTHVAVIHAYGPLVI